MSSLHIPPELYGMTCLSSAADFSEGPRTLGLASCWVSMAVCHSLRRKEQVWLCSNKTLFEEQEAGCPAPADVSCLVRGAVISSLLSSVKSGLPDAAAD